MDTTFDGRLPFAPLQRLVEARLQARGLSLVDIGPASDRRAWYRARQRGWINVRVADRIAVQHDLMLIEIYGPDYDQPGAAA